MTSEMIAFCNESALKLKIANNRSFDSRESEKIMAAYLHDLLDLSVEDTLKLQAELHGLLNTSTINQQCKRERNGRIAKIEQMTNELISL